MFHRSADPHVTEWWRKRDRGTIMQLKALLPPVRQPHAPQPHAHTHTHVHIYPRLCWRTRNAIQNSHRDSNMAGNGSGSQQHTSLRKDYSSISLSVSHRFLLLAKQNGWLRQIFDQYNILTFEEKKKTNLK